MVILVDFDGTCVTHEFPFIGKEIGAVPILKKLVAKGHKLILFTMRSDKEDTQSVEKEIHSNSGNYLQEAIAWFSKHEIPLYGIQTNPTQHTWTSSPKAYGQLSIDDINLGCPLAYNPYLSSRPFVDWGKVETLLKEQNIL
jgi:hypothetical protein